MARGRWLSEEEKAEIARMHAGGMPTAQIASQMQRGIKTIQRVVSGMIAQSVTEDACAEAQAPCQSVSSTPSIPPVTAQVTTSETSVKQARSIQAIQVMTGSEGRPVQNTKVSKRPKKLPQQLPASQSSDASERSTIAHQSSHLVMPLMHSPVTSVPERVIPAANSERFGWQGPTVVPPSPTMPRTCPLQVSTPTVTTTSSTGSIQDTTNQQPSLIVADQQQHDGYVGHRAQSMANLIPYDDSDDDDDMCRSPRATSVVSTAGQQSPQTSGTNTATVEGENRLPPFALEPSSNTMNSPLRSFEHQLQSSQASSWTAITSQIEPEPVVTRKRKADECILSQKGQDPIEHALAMLGDVLVRDEKNHETGLHCERLALLFQRFKADVRLVQLERKEARGGEQGSSEAFSC